jgi:hypothetical protein
MPTVLCVAGGDTLIKMLSYKFLIQWGCLKSIFVVQLPAYMPVIEPQNTLCTGRCPKSKLLGQPH